MKEIKLWEDEVWKPVNDYKGIDFKDLYEVSNYGYVRNKKNKHILRTALTHEGYVHLVLSRNGKQYTRYVHILVENTFVPNPNPFIFTEVHHINEKKDDNRLENLDWIDRSGNRLAGTAQKRRVEKMIKIGRYNPVLCGLDNNTRIKLYTILNKGKKNRKIVSLPNENKLF